LNKSLKIYLRIGTSMCWSDHGVPLLRGCVSMVVPVALPDIFKWMATLLSLVFSIWMFYRWIKRKLNKRKYDRVWLTAKRWVSLRFIFCTRWGSNDSLLDRRAFTVLTVMALFSLLLINSCFILRYIGSMG
jgi:hypothetical protein